MANSGILQWFWLGGLANMAFSLKILVERADLSLVTHWEYSEQENWIIHVCTSGVIFLTIFETLSALPSKLEKLSFNKLIQKTTGFKASSWKWYNLLMGELRKVQSKPTATQLLPHLLPLKNESWLDEPKWTTLSCWKLSIKYPLLLNCLLHRRWYGWDCIPMCAWTLCWTTAWKTMSWAQRHPGWCLPEGALCPRSLRWHVKIASPSTFPVIALH